MKIKPTTFFRCAKVTVVQLKSSGISQPFSSLQWRMAVPKNKDRSRRKLKSKTTTTDFKKKLNMFEVNEVQGLFKDYSFILSEFKLSSGHKADSPACVTSGGNGCCQLKPEEGDRQ